MGKINLFIKSLFISLLFTSSVGAITTQQHLANQNVSMEVARDFIMNNVAYPSTIYTICKQFGVNNDMIAEILASDFPGLTGEVVSAWFDSNGFTGSALGFNSITATVESKATNITSNTRGRNEATFATSHIFVSIPSETFTMGDTRYQALGTATPEHQVTISKDFWMSKHEITNAQFRVFVNETNYQSDLQKTGAPGCWVYDTEEKSFVPTPGRYWANAFSDTVSSTRDNHPVTCVSYNDALAYSKWLSTNIGLEVTLPTDAQWMLTAKGTTQQSYPWGESIPNETRANFCDSKFAEFYPGSLQGKPTMSVNDGWPDTAPVGSYPEGASPYGVLDMAGNVGEWVLDHAYTYTSSPKTDPLNTGSQGQYSSRGGSWVDDYSATDDGHTLLIENRPSDERDGGDDHGSGFRVVINP